MTRFLKLSIILVAILLAGCQGNSGKSDSTHNAGTMSGTNFSDALEFSITGMHSEDDSTFL